MAFIGLVIFAKGPLIRGLIYRERHAALRGGKNIDIELQGKADSSLLSC